MRAYPALIPRKIYKGYIMIERLSPDKIKLYINQPQAVCFLESTTSTNAVATELAAAGNLHGTVIFARHQTAGRGRLGRSFASPDDSGIYMSIILEPVSSNPVMLTTAAAVAVCRAIEKVCGQNPQIKWVNDIYLDSKKVCGILAESITDYKTGHITHVILGIGINCNTDTIPAELADIAGAIKGDYSINQLAAEVYNQMMVLADVLEPSQFIDDYRQRSLVIGKTVSVYKGGYAPDKAGVSARVLDIDDNGGLKVIYSDGSRETLSTGEISIRL